MITTNLPSSFKVITETDNFALMQDLLKEIYDEGTYYFHVVYKPLGSVEISNNSYPLCLSILSQAESNLKTATNIYKEATAPTEANTVQ